MVIGNFALHSTLNISPSNYIWSVNKVRLSTELTPCYTVQLEGRMEVILLMKNVTQRA